MSWPAAKPYKGNPSPRPRGRPGGLSKPAPRHLPRSIPPGMPKFPVPVSPNLTAATKLAPRILPRLVPGLGWGLTAYTLYEWYQSAQQQVNTAKYDLTLKCADRPGWTVGTTSGFSSCPGYTTSPVGGSNHVNLMNLSEYTSNAAGFAEKLWRIRPSNSLQIEVYNWKDWNKRPNVDHLPTLIPAQYTVVRSVPYYGSPAGLPIMKPAGTPRPKSWPEAVAPPGTQPSANPKPQPKPKTNPAKNPRPEALATPPLPWPVVFMPPSIPRPDGTPAPLQPPNVIIRPNPGTNTPGQPAKPGVTTRPGSPANRAPERGVKERKINAKTVLGAGVMAAVGIPGEVGDFVDAMWKALPDELRTQVYYKGKKKDPNYMTKAKDLYNNLEYMNVAEWFVNYVNNQTEDAFFGSMGKVQKKFNQVADTPTSGGALQGPEDAPDGAYKKSPIPQLTYDKETGKWGLSWLDYSATT